MGLFWCATLGRLMFLVASVQFTSVAYALIGKKGEATSMFMKPEDLIIFRAIDFSETKVRGVSLLKRIFPR